MGYRSVQSKPKHMTVNMVNTIISNVNVKRSAYAYSQLKRWDAQPI